MMTPFFFRLSHYRTLLVFSLILFLYGCQTTQQIQEEPAVKIAVLLPLSGPTKDEGKALAEMVRQGVNDALRVKVDLHFYDSTTNATLKSSMRRIIASDTKIIIGPINSKQTKKVARYTHGRDIDVISLSNNPALSSSNIYVFGHQPMKQTERLIEEFLRQDHRQFITLTPNKKFHRSIATIIQDEVITHNGVMAGEYYYDVDPESIAKNVKSISKLVDLLNEDPDNERKPVIYIAGSSPSLDLLYNAALAFNLDKKAILCGETTIDIDYPGNIELYLASSNNIIASNLDEKAEILLGRRYLNFLELLAYDAGHMVATAMQDHYTQENFRKRLIASQGFIGMSGITYLGSHIAERNYDIVKRSNGQYSEVFKTGIIAR